MTLAPAPVPSSPVPHRFTDDADTLIDALALLVERFPDYPCLTVLDRHGREARLTLGGLWARAGGGLRRPPRRARRGHRGTSSRWCCRPAGSCWRRTSARCAAAASRDCSPGPSTARRTDRYRAYPDWSRRRRRALCATTGWRASARRRRARPPRPAPLTPEGLAAPRRTAGAAAPRPTPSPPHSTRRARPARRRAFC